MAYDTANPPRKISDSIGASNGALWIYVDADPILTVQGAGYFSNGEELGMQLNDAVIVVDEGASAAIAAVTAISAAGAVTVV